MKRSQVNFIALAGAGLLASGLFAGESHGQIPPLKAEPGDNPFIAPMWKNMGTGKPVMAGEQALLRWPTPPGGERYGVIDGRRLKTYVEALAGISRHYRDQGHQEWGRLQGTSADRETAAWVEAQFRRIGLSDVRQQPVDMPPQWRYDSWSLTVDDGKGGAIALKTAEPETRALTPPGGLNVEVVYVGLGTVLDFAGRDVRGKAVLIRSEPWPAIYAHSAGQDGAVQRATELGAAAVITVIDVPGNIRTKRGDGRPAAIPTFTLGYDDGQALQRAIEAAPEGRRASVNIKVAGKVVDNQKTANVWGVLPGATDETVYVIAHRDGYFEGATDNASGVATMLGLAEFYSRIPQAQRRRTLIFIGTPGHHGANVGVPALAAEGEKLFSKTALVINCEHTSRSESLVFGYNGTNGGPRIRIANRDGPMFWYAGGSAAFKNIVAGSFKSFGVPLYLEPDRVALGETSPIYRMGSAAFQVVDAWIFFHTDQETPNEVPYTGLEATTRAFAKIIDEANKLDRAALARTKADPE